MKFDFELVPCTLFDCLLLHIWINEATLFFKSDYLGDHHDGLEILIVHGSWDLWGPAVVVKVAVAVLWLILLLANALVTGATPYSMSARKSQCISSCL
jgi:hypothetical protein